MEEAKKKTILEQTLDQWEIDAQINRTEPGKELLRIPVLHAKYTRLLTSNSLRVRMLNKDLIRARKIKFDYFGGRMDRDELNQRGLPPFKYTLKNEVDKHVDADEEILKLQTKKDLHEEMVSLCTSIIKELNARTWQLRAFIDFERFIGGQ
jgi:hypothetical protein